jgi:hypothetical protein
VTVGHRHHYFVQAHDFAPHLTYVCYPEVYLEAPMRIMPTTTKNTKPDEGGLGCQVC